MMAYYYLSIILGSILLVVFMVVLIVYLLSSSYKNQSVINYNNKRSSYINRKTDILDHKELLNKIQTERDKFSYTNEFIQFIKNYTAQIAVIKFRTFIDTHDIEKSTNQQYQKVIKEIAGEVKVSLKYLDIGLIILTETAIDKLIVDYSIMYIKDLINKNFGEEPQFDIQD